MADEMHEQGQCDAERLALICGKRDFFKAGHGNVLLAMELFILRLHCDLVRRIPYERV